jgi:hypothetical protein
VAGSHPVTLAPRYRISIRAVAVPAFIVEITAKVIYRSDTAAEDLPADIYSQLSEFISNDDDIVDLSVEVFGLPADLSGTAPH